MVISHTGYVILREQWRSLKYVGVAYLMVIGYINSYYAERKT